MLLLLHCLWALIKTICWTRLQRREFIPHTSFPPSPHLFSAHPENLCDPSGWPTSPSANAMFSVATTATTAMFSIATASVLPRDFPPTDQELSDLYLEQKIALSIVLGLVFLFIVAVVVLRECYGFKGKRFGRKPRDDVEEQRELTKLSSTSADSVGPYSRNPTASEGFQVDQQSSRIQRLAPVHLALGASFDEARSVSLGTSSDQARSVSLSPSSDEARVMKQDGPYYEIDLSDPPSRSNARRKTSVLGKCSVQ